MKIVLAWTLGVLFTGAVAALAQTGGPQGARPADSNPASRVTAVSTQAPLPPPLPTAPATTPATTAPAEVVPAPPPPPLLPASTPVTETS